MAPPSSGSVHRETVAIKLPANNGVKLALSESLMKVEIRFERLRIERLLTGTLKE